MEVFEQAFGVSWLAAAPSTLTRFWNKISTRRLAETLQEKARDLARRIVREDGAAEDFLALDSTVVTRYGGQEGAAPGYNPHKLGRPSHPPPRWGATPTSGSCA